MQSVTKHRLTFLAIIILVGAILFWYYMSTPKAVPVSRISSQAAKQTFLPASYDLHGGEGLFDQPKAEVIFSNTGTVQKVSLDEISTLFHGAFQNLQNYQDTSIYNINIEASIQLGFGREVPDTRVFSCQERTASERTRPLVSIVIPFHMEHWSVLLRTLHSLYRTTPIDLIEDIVLVDDFNQAEVLRAPLQKYLKHLPKVRLLRTFEQEGLIRARLVGARAAWGEVLVILDAHVEFNEDWLPPLLEQIAKNKSTIALPALDYIDPFQFQYKQMKAVHYGIFDWELNYNWARVPARTEEEFVNGQAIRTPTISGSAIAVNRDYFFSMGSYDEGLTIWGGESLELSFRWWMCGGQVVIVPCSKLGHLFRTNLPYIFDQTIVNKNLQRVAEVWMDNYKTSFFLASGFSYAFAMQEKLSLRRRKILRQKLQCRDFDWYLTHIAKVASPPRSQDLFSGSITNVAHRTCIYANNVTDMIFLRDCTAEHQQLVFHFTANGTLQHSSGLCLGFQSKKNDNVGILTICNASDSLQKWSYSPILPDVIKEKLAPAETNKPVGQYRWGFTRYEHCLQSVPLSSGFSLSLLPCNFVNPAQYWIATHRIHKHVVMRDNIPNWFL